MAIATFDDFVGAAKTRVQISKTATATTVAAQWHTLFDRAGSPGAGSLAVGNTSAGVVPTSATSGCPILPTTSGGQVLYLAGVDFGSTVASRLRIYDRLYHVGSVSMTSLATTTLSSQPSYSTRLPSTSYNGLEIWLEFNTAVSATATTVAVTYTDQDGTAGATTGATATLSGFVTGRMLRMPLAAGDSGVQKIESIIVGGTVATTGTVNVIVARPLFTGRVMIANGGDSYGLERLLLQQIYTGSALTAMVCADSTSSGVPDMDLTVALA